MKAVLEIVKGNLKKNKIQQQTHSTSSYSYGNQQVCVCFNFC